MTREEAIKLLAELKEYPDEIEQESLDMAIKALEQESVLDKVRKEIAEYGSIWVAYAITGHSDRDIENLIEGVLKQAKEQVLNIIDKYRTESEE
jgi:hypothetical protein